MKNIIKIVSSALVATIALSTVAFAAPSTGLGGSTGGDSTPSTSNGGSTAGHSVPSTGNGGSTAGNPSTNNGGGSDNGSSKSSKRRSSGGSYRVTATLTNVKVNVAGNVATVTWDTNPSAQGMLVYGPVSLTVPTNATQFYGYAAGTAVSGATTKHSHTFTIAPGVTYFVRPVAIVGTRVIYGSETKVSSTKTTEVVKGDSTFDQPVITKPVETVAPTTTATTSENTANVSGFGSKIGSFFKKIWNAITAPLCR